MQPGMSSIRLATAACIRLFQSLSSLLLTTESELKLLLDEAALEDEFGRFRVWSGNLGALQKGHSSLDYRLRDSPLLSSNALKFLKELEENLTETINVLSGSRLPYEQQTKPDATEDEQDDFYSEDEDDGSDSGRPKTELEQRFADTMDIIDNLYKLSVRIRTPTLRTRSLKAAAYRPKDQETGVDLLDQYAKYDLEHTKELLQSLRAPQEGAIEGGDAAIADVLLERLSKSITLRRRQFKYYRRHRDKLGLSTVAEEVLHAAMPILERNEIPRHDTMEVQLDVSPLPLILKEDLSEKTGKTLLSGTEATHHHQSLDDIVDSKSVTSYATTVHDLSGKGVELPSPPKSAEGDKDFECPYCFIICPARYGRGRPWRTHLLQDLQPYICTYAECDSGEQLFRSRREWIEHEGTHRKAWRCLEHADAVYSSRAGLEHHLHQKHEGTISEYQFDSIIKLGETSTVDMRQKCPICFADATMDGGLQNHLANHLERLASFALPKDVETADDESGGGSSAASQGTSQDLSDVSFPTENEQEQGFEEAEESLPTSTNPSFEEAVDETIENKPAQLVQNVLSAETLRDLQDATKSRLDILLEARNLDDTGSFETDEFNFPDDDDQTRELDEHFAEIETFRSYLLSLPGSESVRFLRRYGFWRGYANFKDEASTTQALRSFDRPQFRTVKIRQGVENKASLKFSLPSQTKQPSAHQTQPDQDGSLSSASVSYGDFNDKEQMPILPVADIPTLRSLYRSRKLQQRDQSYAPNDAYNQMVSFTFYDIARLRVGAIVNSANRAMKITRTNDSLNHYIHKAAGPGLKRECASIGRVKVGQVRMTSGHLLPCTYIIHAARPQYSDSKKGMGKLNLLSECYRGALKTARENNIKTIALPCLAAGGCGFPSRVAARVALQEVREFLDVYKTNPFERIIFCVFNGTDQQSYKDFLPIFFPPTHGDIENSIPIDNARDPASLTTQIRDTYAQLEEVSDELSEFREHIHDFPRSIFDELAAISTVLRTLNRHIDDFEVNTRFKDQDTADLDLLCSVLLGACESIMEIIEQSKYTKDSGERSHKKIWDDYNFHLKNSQGLSVSSLFELCQDFVQCLEDILVRGGDEPYEMTTMRVRLGTFRLKQTGTSHKEVEDKFAEVMYTREFQGNVVTTARTDIVQLHQIPSISRLYQLSELGSRPTNAIPNSRFNRIVCLLREDVTRLEVDVVVNSTDMGFSGMGTLDRTVFRKGGVDMVEACSKFGVCKEGDVRVSEGYMLPCKQVIHTIPPETYRSNTKDVLRKIYRQILFMATSLKATSVAIPTIGTGMLNYPRRDCASLALEEVKRFLETTDETNPIEKIIFCVFGSIDEFVYKSALPIFFPPVESTTNNAKPPVGWPSPGSVEAGHSKISGEPSPPPRRTIFGSIGEAFRSVKFGKQPSTPASRSLNNAEEHALTNFEAHAQSCLTCKNIAKLYAEDKDLCPEGYGEAQGVLQYLYMEADRSVYSTTPSGDNKRVKVEIPQDYPLSWNLLLTVEKSYRDPDRTRPFATPNQSYALRHEKQEQRGLPTIDAADPVEKERKKATAAVYTWSESTKDWKKIQPYECSIYIHDGRLDVFEVDYGTDRQLPLLSLELTNSVPVTKQTSTEVAIQASNLQESRSAPLKSVVFQSRSPAECDIFFEQIQHARTNKLQPAPVRHPATATAQVFNKSQDEEDWKIVCPYECTINIYLGRLEIYENEGSVHAMPPLMAFELSPSMETKTAAADITFQAQALPESRVKTERHILLRSGSVEECNALYEFIVWGSANNPTHLAQQPKRIRGAGTEKRDQTPVIVEPQQEPKVHTSLLTQQLQSSEGVSTPGESGAQQSSQSDFSTAGLSTVNVDDFFSYHLGYAELESSRKPKNLNLSSLKRTVSRSGRDFQPGMEQDEELDQAIHHPRPIAPGARWTKVDRRLVNAKALEEANERFETREDCFIVLRVVTREEIMRLAERTRDIRRGGQVLEGFNIEVGTEN